MEIIGNAGAEGVVAMVIIFMALILISNIGKGGGGGKR